MKIVLHKNFATKLTQIMVHINTNVPQNVNLDAFDHEFHAP